MNIKLLRQLGQSLLAFHVTIREAGPSAGQTHDGQIADTLFDNLAPRTIALANTAYGAHDADRIRELIQDHGTTRNITPKSNRR